VIDGCRWSGGEEDPLTWQVRVGAAVHLPLEHFDAVDVALDGCDLQVWEVDAQVGAGVTAQR
jgi:hypothetical protein